MSKELVIASNRHETKVAVLEDDQLVEVYFQRANEYSLAGSIHKGRVTRVLPGMQSAFVDLGLERDTFLYVSDFFEENEDFDPVSAEPLAYACDEPRPNAAADRGNDRGDRRGDRGRDRGPRYQDRSPEARSPEARAASVPAETLGEPSSVAAPMAALSESGETINPTLARGAPLETRSEGDRQDRDRNDDRRRRSRRRRTRGRGFPENKYAASGGAGAGSEPEPAVQYVAPEAPLPEDAAVRRSANDLLILPGESLAKYRQGGSPVVEEIEKEAVHETGELAQRPIDEDEKLEIVSKIEDRLDEIESSEEEHELLLHGHGAVVHPERDSAAGIAPLILRPEVKASPQVVPLEEAAEAAEELDLRRAPHADTHPLSLVRSDEASAAYEARIAAELHEAIRGDQVEPIEPELAEETEVELSDEERAEALAQHLISDDFPADESAETPKMSSRKGSWPLARKQKVSPPLRLLLERHRNPCQPRKPLRFANRAAVPCTACLAGCADVVAEIDLAPSQRLPWLRRSARLSLPLLPWKCAWNPRPVRRLARSALNGLSVLQDLSSASNGKSDQGPRRNGCIPPSPIC